MRSMRSTQKLIRRHPHIFGDETARTEGDVRKRWGEIKAEEKRENGRPEADSARRSSARAAGAGRGAADRLPRRTSWLRLAKYRSGSRQAGRRAAPNSTRAAARRDEVEDELGDMLFVIVNLARFVKVDPEQALRRTNAKFRHRFGYIESQARRARQTLARNAPRRNGSAVAGGEGVNDRDPRA